jgi:hypothetical protein
MLNTNLGRNIEKCIRCQNDVVFRFKPMAQWNLVGDGFICGKCYEEKLAEYYLTPDRRNLTKQVDKST